MTTEPQAQNSERRFRDVFSVLKRRWGILITTVIVCVAASLLVTFLTPPVYASSVQIELEGRTRDFSTSAADPLTPLSLVNPTDDLPTQVEVLTSLEVYARASQRANIVPRRADDGGQLDPIVRAKQVGQTNVIQITAESTVPDHATSVASAVPNAYRDYVQQKLAATLDNEILYLRNELQQRQQDLNTAQNNLNRFRTVNKITSGEQENQERLNHIAAAESDLRSADQRVQSARDYANAMESALAKQPLTIQAPSNATTDRDVEVQKQRVADLQGQLAAKQEIYTDSSQEVRSIKAELVKQQAYLKSMPKIYDTSGKIRNPLVDTYQEKVDEAKGQLDGAVAARAVAASGVEIANRELVQFNSLKGQYDKLTLSVTTATQNLDRTNALLQDLSVRQSKAKSPVTTIQNASVPEVVRPKGLVNVVLGLLVGVIAGVALASIRERYDDRIWTPDGVLEASGLKALGNIGLGSSNLPALITSDRTLATNDSYRLLRTSLINTATGEAFRNVAVTSALGNEGRSETAVNLAASLAMGGHQVLLLDANFRAPALSSLMNVPEGPGLAEILRKQATSRDSARQTSVDGLHVITAGTMDGAAAELLGTDTFSSLLEDLKERYHFVIVDTSPCLAGADGPVTAAACEATIFVVKLGTSRRTATRYCTEQLHRTRAQVLGIVTNRPGANPRSEYRDYVDA